MMTSAFRVTKRGCASRLAIALLAYAIRGRLGPRGLRIRRGST